MPREYGVDVSAHQPSSLAQYRTAGAKFAIIKASEGTSYRSPVAAEQVRSAHHNRFESVHAYHFANFSNSVHQAKKEAKFFIEQAKRLNIAKDRFLVLDWEASQSNYVQGSAYQNTKAIKAFMSKIKRAGYKPMLYSGASLLRNNIETTAIVKKFGTCLWVASYKTMAAQYEADFGYFPSMNGIAIWQFTDNWRGLNVDGNISLVSLTHKAKAEKPAKHVTPKIVYAPVINNDPHYMISLRNEKGHATGKFIPTNSRWKVFGDKIINGHRYYKLGSNEQWVPAKYLKEL